MKSGMTTEEFYALAEKAIGMTTPEAKGALKILNLGNGMRAFLLRLLNLDGPEKELMETLLTTGPDEGKWKSVAHFVAKAQVIPVLESTPEEIAKFSRPLIHQTVEVESLEGKPGNPSAGPNLASGRTIKKGRGMEPCAIRAFLKWLHGAKKGDDLSYVDWGDMAVTLNPELEVRKLKTRTAAASKIATVLVDRASYYFGLIRYEGTRGQRGITVKQRTPDDHFTFEEIQRWVRERYRKKEEEE